MSNININGNGIGGGSSYDGNTNGNGHFPLPQTPVRNRGTSTGSGGGGGSNNSHGRNKSHSFTFGTPINKNNNNNNNNNNNFHPHTPHTPSSANNNGSVIMTPHRSMSTNNQHSSSINGLFYNVKEQPIKPLPILYDDKLHASQFNKEVMGKERYEKLSAIPYNGGINIERDIKVDIDDDENDLFDMEYNGNDNDIDVEEEEEELHYLHHCSNMMMNHSNNIDGNNNNMRSNNMMINENEYYNEEIGISQKFAYPKHNNYFTSGIISPYGIDHQNIIIGGRNMNDGGVGGRGGKKDSNKKNNNKKKNDDDGNEKEKEKEKETTGFNENLLLPVELRAWENDIQFNNNHKNNMIIDDHHGIIAEEKNNNNKMYPLLQRNASEMSVLSDIALYDITNENDHHLTRFRTESSDNNNNMNMNVTQEASNEQQPSGGQQGQQINGRQQQQINAAGPPVHRRNDTDHTVHTEKFRAKKEKLKTVDSMGALHSKIREEKDFLWDNDSWANQIVMDASNPTRPNLSQMRLKMDNESSTAAKSISNRYHHRQPAPKIIFDENDTKLCFQHKDIKRTRHPEIKTTTPKIMDNEESQKILSSKRIIETNIGNKKQAKAKKLLQEEGGMPPTDLKRQNIENQLELQTGGRKCLPQIKVPNVESVQKHKFYKTWAKPKEAFHRPKGFSNRMTIVNTATLINSSRRHDVQNYPPMVIKDLALSMSSEREDFVLFEYIEERPLVMSTVGMKSKIINFWLPPERDIGKVNNSNAVVSNTEEDIKDYKKFGRLGRIVARAKLGGNEHFFAKQPFGNTRVLNVDQKPFLLSDLDREYLDRKKCNPLSAIVNNLYRAPIFHHTHFSFCDFLLIKDIYQNRDGEEITQFTVKEIKNVFLCGQTEPEVRIPQPQKDKNQLLTTFGDIDRKRKAFQVYQFFKQKVDSEVKNSDLTKIFSSEIPELAGLDNRHQIWENVGVKNCAEYLKKNGGTWKKKATNKDFPKIASLISHFTPEDNCKFESSFSRIEELRKLGIEHIICEKIFNRDIKEAISYLQEREKTLKILIKRFSKQAKSSMHSAIITKEVDNLNAQKKKIQRHLSVAAFIVEEIRLCPWVRSDDFLTVKESMETGGIEMMEIASDIGFNFLKVKTDNQKQVRTVTKKKREDMIKAKFKEYTAHTNMNMVKYEDCVKGLKKIDKKRYSDENINRITAEYTTLGTKRKKLAELVRKHCEFEVQKQIPDTKEEILARYRKKIKQSWIQQLEYLVPNQVELNDDDDDDDNRVNDDDDDDEFMDFSSDSDTEDDDTEYDENQENDFKQNIQEPNFIDHPKPRKVLKVYRKRILSDGTETVQVDFIFDDEKIEEARKKKDQKMQELMNKEKREKQAVGTARVPRGASKNLARGRRESVETDNQAPTPQVAASSGSSVGITSRPKGKEAGRLLQLHKNKNKSKVTTGSSSTNIDDSKKTKKRKRDDEKDVDNGYAKVYNQKEVSNARGRKSRNKPNQRLIEMLEETLTQIKKQIISEPFRAAVPKNIPRYKQIIKKPMYINLMLKKARDFKYFSRKEVIADFELMRKNAAVFNGDTSVMALHARQLKDLVIKYFEEKDLQFKSAELACAPLDDVPAITTNTHSADSIDNSKNTTSVPKTSISKSKPPKLITKKKKSSSGLPGPPTFTKSQFVNQQPVSSTSQQHSAEVTNILNIPKKKTTIKLKGKPKLMPSKNTTFAKPSSSSSASNQPKRVISLSKKKKNITQSKPPKNMTIRIPSKPLKAVIESDSSGSDDDDGEEEVIDEGY